MIYGMKEDLRHKACLVTGGHLVNSLDDEFYSSMMRGVNVKLFHVVIAYKTDMTPLCGNIRNTFVNAFTNKKVSAVAGKEFGKALEGSIIIIIIIIKKTL